VVDDDADVAAMVVQALTDAGYQAEACLDCTQVVATVRRLLPDLVLLDLLMHPITGYELAPLLRRHPTTAHIPIIITSASYRMEQRRIELGLRYAIPRPFDLDWVLDAVAAVLADPAGAQLDRPAMQADNDHNIQGQMA
jgi:CheY-like chemotaxis protein